MCVFNIYYVFYFCLLAKLQTTLQANISAVGGYDSLPASGAIGLLLGGSFKNLNLKGAIYCSTQFASLKENKAAQALSLALSPSVLSYPAMTLTLTTENGTIGFSAAAMAPSRSLTGSTAQVAAALSAAVFAPPPNAFGSMYARASIAVDNVLQDEFSLLILVEHVPQAPTLGGLASAVKVGHGGQ